MSFASVNVTVGQCLRCDKKQNIKLNTNLTCDELVPLKFLPLAHVDVIRVAQPLLYQQNDIGTRGPIQYRIRYLIIRSRKVLKARDRMLNRSYRSGI